MGAVKSIAYFQAVYEFLLLFTTVLPEKMLDFVLPIVVDLAGKSLNWHNLYLRLQIIRDIAKFFRQHFNH